jgi:hypothetical protein
MLQASIVQNWQLFKGLKALLVALRVSGCFSSSNNTMIATLAIWIAMRLFYLSRIGCPNGLASMPRALSETFA